MLRHWGRDRMTEFFQALFDPAVPFLRFALLAGVLSSVAFGTVGTFVVARRISYIAGAVAHSVLGGVGVALYLRRSAGISWLTPFHGAVVAALLSALVIGWVSLAAREREDTVIGAIWAVGMAVGLLFIAATPGYFDPMSYLFGNILMISTSDLWVIAGLDALVVLVAFRFLAEFQAICFDEEFARARGLPVNRLYLLLLCLTALTVVLLVSVVGIVMVVALLTLPAAAAGGVTQKLGHMIGLAILLCLLFTSGGVALSFMLDLRSGPVIILLAATAYLVLALGRRMVAGAFGANRN
jgi:zinc transport system permease protein